MRMRLIMADPLACTRGPSTRRAPDGSATAELAFVLCRMRRAGFNHGFRSSLLLKSWVASRQTSQVERTPAGRYEMAKSGRYRLSDPVDARGVAPRRGEMDVQVLCFRVRELALYRSFEAADAKIHE